MILIDSLHMGIMRVLWTEQSLCMLSIGLPYNIIVNDLIV